MRQEAPTLDEAVKVIDAAFHELARRGASHGMDVSVADAVEGAWQLFERGRLHMTDGREAGSIVIVETRTPVERFRRQRLHRKIVERWRTMREAAGRG